LDELGVLDAIRRLQEGKDLAGFELDGSPEFFSGCSLSHCADDALLEVEIERVRKKVEAGARFLVIPPLFDIDRSAELIRKVSALNVPVIPTVFLIKSVAVARYIAINEPGAHLSEDLIRRIRKAADREMEGIKVAGEAVAGLKKTAQGVLIQTLGWEHRLPAILDVAGL